jgi:hypothetical protein
MGLYPMLIKLKEAFLLMMEYFVVTICFKSIREGTFKIESHMQRTFLHIEHSVLAFKLVVIVIWLTLCISLLILIESSQLTFALTMKHSLGRR